CLSSVVGLLGGLPGYSPANRRVPETRQEFSMGRKGPSGLMCCVGWKKLAHMYLLHRCPEISVHPLTFGHDCAPPHCYGEPACSQTMRAMSSSDVPRATNLHRWSSSSSFDARCRETTRRLFVRRTSAILNHRPSHLSSDRTVSVFQACSP